MISQTKVTCRHSVEYVVLQERYEEERYPVGKLPLEWHERQNHRLNCQADVQIYSQCVWNNYESASAVIGNCSLDHDPRCRSRLSRPQTVWLQAFSWPSSDQHTAITGTKTESAFIKNHNRSPLRPLMSSGLTPLESQTAMAWSQWNARYRAPGSELFFK